MLLVRGRKTLHGHSLTAGPALCPFALTRTRRCHGGQRELLREACARFSPSLSLPLMISKERWPRAPPGAGIALQGGSAPTTARRFTDFLSF